MNLQNDFRLLNLLHFVRDCGLHTWSVCGCCMSLFFDRFGTKCLFITDSLLPCFNHAVPSSHDG